MEEFQHKLPPSPEQRVTRLLLVSGVLMIAFAYLYRWGVTDRFYDIPHAAPNTPTLADTGTSTTQ
ncbi:hypothetical protein HY374_03650 [Candidatus Berkelbacteria bacterium]|nr:hypothetical protein [Candidatus Berkelbacteria bacterium]